MVAGRPGRTPPRLVLDQPAHPAGRAADARAAHAWAGNGRVPAGRAAPLRVASGAARAVAAALVGRGATVERAARRPEASTTLAAAVPGVRATD